MAEEKKYYIRVRGALVQVTSEVYKACHQAKRRVKTLYEKDERNKLVSYDAKTTSFAQHLDNRSHRDRPPHANWTVPVFVLSSNQSDA